MNCPSCSSDNTQTIKMMCLNSSSASYSTAVGINSNLGIGVAQINTTSQSSLARIYHPGEYPNVDLEVGKIFIFTLIFILSIYAGGGGGVFFAVVSFPCILWGVSGYFSKKADMVIFDGKKRVYDSAWICHKCGQSWTPELIARPKNS